MIGVLLIYLNGYILYILLQNIYEHLIKPNLEEVKQILDKLKNFLHKFKSKIFKKKDQQKLLESNDT